MKQAYEQNLGEYDWELREIEVLPKCKRVIEKGGEWEYQLVRRKVFGFIPWTYWLYKKRIKWYDSPTVEYYDCSCGEPNE